MSRKIRVVESICLQDVKEVIFVQTNRITGTGTAEEQIGGSRR